MTVKLAQTLAVTAVYIIGGAALLLAADPVLDQLTVWFPSVFLKS